MLKMLQNPNHPSIHCNTRLANEVGYYYIAPEPTRGHLLTTKHRDITENNAGLVDYEGGEHVQVPAVLRCFAANTDTSCRCVSTPPGVYSAWNWSPGVNDIAQTGNYTLASGGRIPAYRYHILHCRYL